MPTANPRALWKGAISFGLVHIPVALYTATQESRPKMRMLDQATGAPVGYRKVTKDTGETVDKSDVVKGLEVEAGQYVTLTREEIQQALPQSTQTIGIESFVKLEQVPTVFYNKPYYTGPLQRGAKVYALLREVLRRTGRAALGRVVIANRQHLALLVPLGDALVLNLLRWENEIRDPQALGLPDAQEALLSERELTMGEQLVLELADDWHPERFRDEFRDKLEALVEAKRQAGDVRQAPVAEGEPAPASTAEVIDLTELLRQSLKRTPAPAPSPTKAAAARKTAPRPSPGRKAANDARAAERAAAAAAAKPPAKARASAKPGAGTRPGKSRSG